MDEGCGEVKAGVLVLRCTALSCLARCGRRWLPWGGRRARARQWAARRGVWWRLGAGLAGCGWVSEPACLCRKGDEAAPLTLCASLLLARQASSQPRRSRLSNAFSSHFLHAAQSPSSASSSRPCTARCMMLANNVGRHPQVDAILRVQNRQQQQRGQQAAQISELLGGRWG